MAKAVTKNKAAKLPVQSWKQTLPGKILVAVVCILPFLTMTFELPLSDAVRDAYFLSAETTNEFEQYFRQLILLVTAVLAVGWFCYERAALRPRRQLSVSKSTAVALISIGVYLILGLLSTVLSPYVGDCWFGIYMMYEGYASLFSYGIVFAAAWYWLDGHEVLDFAKTCLTVLSIAIGLLAILEKMGYGYYNNAIVKLFSGLQGDVGVGDAAVLTFGNSDYLGIYCAMLLPLMVSLISRELKTSRMAVQIGAAVLAGIALLTTKVMNAIVIGFGVTVLLLLVWMLRSGWKRSMKVICTCSVVLAILAGGIGFVMTRTGGSFSEKMKHTMVGIEQTDSFQLLSMAIEGDTIVLENENTTFAVTTDSDTVSADALHFTCNGAEVIPVVKGDQLRFSETELSGCTVEIADEQLNIHLGYPTPVQALRQDGKWKIIGIGGDLLEEIPLVSDSKELQKLYPYLNGRIFVWADTVSVLGDCLFIGHGPCTSIHYLEQNDLPALLNIFGRYVLYNKPHNWYLQMAQDTGVLSLVAVLLALVLVIFRGCCCCFGKNYKWNAFQAGVLFALIGYCLCGLFNDSLIYHAPLFWLLLGLGLRLTEKQKES